MIADVLEQEGRTLADELGDHAIFSRLDVTSEEDWAATVAAAEDAFGPVSVLVNNAAIVRFGPIAETEPAAWRQVIDINLTGTYLGIRAVVPSMRKAGGGAIVNISAAAETVMPYVHLDLPGTYPVEVKRELATRLCRLYADVMETQPWRPRCRDRRSSVLPTGPLPRPLRAEAHQGEEHE